MVDTDLSFERSEVEATLTAPIVSIKNPISGRIFTPAADGVIMDIPEARGRDIFGGNIANFVPDDTRIPATANETENTAFTVTVGMEINFAKCEKKRYKRRQGEPSGEKYGVCTHSFSRVCGTCPASHNPAFRQDGKRVV